MHDAERWIMGSDWVLGHVLGHGLAMCSLRAREKRVSTTDSRSRERDVQIQKSSLMPCLYGRSNAHVMVLG